MIRSSALISALLALAVAGLLPVAMVLGDSLFPQGSFSLEFYRQTFSSERQWQLLANSLTLSLLVALFATLAGVPLGVLLGKCDLRFRKSLTFLFCTPLVLPPYVTALCWLQLLGRNGRLAEISPEWAARTSSWLFSLYGCVGVLTCTFLPVVMLLTIFFVRNVEPQLEQAALLSAPWGTVLGKVTLPLASRGIVLAALLVFLLTLGEFGVPMFLRCQVFAVEAFTRFAAFADYQAAAAAAVPLALVAIALAAGEGILLERHGIDLPNVSGRRPLIDLGRGRWAATAVPAALCVVLVVLPYSALIVQSASLSAYAEAAWRSGDALLRSLTYAAAGAGLLLVVGFPLAYWVRNRVWPFCKGVETLGLILFTLPSTVVGIGLVRLWNRPGWDWVYSTPIIILLGYVAQYTALSSRILTVALRQISPSMEEAAEMAGGGWLRRSLRILLPVARRGVAAAWLVCFLFCLRDTGISMMVYPPGSDTLPIRIFTLMANGPPDLIAAMCVLLMAAALTPLAILTLLQSRWRKEPS